MIEGVEKSSSWWIRELERLIGTLIKDGLVVIGFEEEDNFRLKGKRKG